MSRFSFIFTFIVLITNYHRANSQCIAVPVSLAERIAEAELILEGKITEITPAWNADKSSIYTISEIEIYKVFKGEILAEKINLVTLGGRIEDVMVVVEPELEPELSSTGIFFLQPFKGSLEESLILHFEPVAASQGFIQYAPNGNTAIGVFEKYGSITNELYPAIIKHTNTKREIKAFYPDATKEEPGSYALLAVPDITNISPAATTAGTYSIITINGSNFGASYDAAGTSALEFKDANTGGAGYLTTPDNHILSWTDNQIQAYVPTRAGTGTIRVTNNSNETATSVQTITIDYNQSNPQSGGIYYEPNLIQDSGTPGYRFSYSTSTANNGVSFDGHTDAKARFEAALETWRCNTGFNVDVTATTNTTTAAVSDGINAVLFDNDVDFLPNGVLGRATSRYGICGSEAVLTEIDVVFKRDGTNTPAITWYFGEEPTNIPFTSYDFESVALHELGHGHQLGHIISPGAVMHYAIANFAIARTPSATNDIAGGTYVMSHSTGFSNCGVTGIISHNCALPVHLTAFYGAVNHSKASITWKTEQEHISHFILERSEDGILFQEVQTISTTGKKENTYTTEDLVAGLSQVYYRLKMVELDGSHEYSNTIVLSSDLVLVKVYPNPASSNLKELFIETATGDLNLSVFVTDALGRVNAIEVLRKSGNSLVIEKPKSPGLYQLTLITNKDKITTSLVVE